MIVLIEKTENGKIELTKEKLESLLEKARQVGVNEAQKTTYYVEPLNPYGNRPPFSGEISHVQENGTEEVNGIYDSK